MADHDGSAMAPCMWCGRTIAIIEYQGQRVVCRHDNRNNSGFCKGSLAPLFASSEGVDR